MKNHFYISLLLLFGFLLMPNLNYACGVKSEKECCKKEISSKTEKKDCCKNSQSNNKNKNCNGKCGHSNCTTTSVNYSFVTLNEIEFIINAFDFSNKKQQFFNLKTFISSGYSSIWLIPKIS